MESLSTEAQFRVKEATVENTRPMKVKVIGAGFSGIYLGIRISQRLRNIDFQIYEKNAGVGGVWWENRYPGCACDIPAHSYQYSFEPNPNWSSMYASSTEFARYLQGVAEKYGATRFIKLRHVVKECTWQESTSKWSIIVENLNTGEIIHEEADALIACKGALNGPSWPKLPGLSDFQGTKMHSAAWGQSYDFKHKRVGLIGSGSSSIQILLVLQKVEGIHISAFVRNRTWIANPFGEMSMIKLGLDPANLYFSEEDRKRFSDAPGGYLKFRKVLEDDGNAVHFATQKGSDMQAAFVVMCRVGMTERLAKRPEIAAALDPAFGVGCRRITPGPGYLEALCEDNVGFITEEIAEINAKTIELESGKQIPVDVICCATGFDVSGAPPFTITGLHGQSMEEKFKPFPKTYLALAVDDFPNYWIMLGPNSGIGAGSLTVTVEAQGDYIVKCIRKLQKEDYKSMVVKRARVQDFSDYVYQYFKRTVYMDDCKSWYKSEGGRGDRITGLWPGSLLQLVEILRAPRWEDYEFESGEENRLRWIGNGFSECLMEGGDPSYYLNADFVDVPPVETPEMDEKFSLRPFSH